MAAPIITPNKPASYERKKPLAAYHNQVIPAAMRLDYSLYSQLLAHRSHSGSKAQTKYVQFLKSWILANIPGATTTQDRAGNLYVTKGAASVYPCFVSHCDINQAQNANVSPLKGHNWITGIDTLTGERAGLGHDDKAGNLLALQMLRHLPTCKAIFTTDEETGGQGAARADQNFFKDCAFCLQADRNAYKGPEIITYSGGTDMCCPSFLAAAGATMARYNFTESRGIFTDVNVLKDKGLKICAVNLTAGYFDEHRNIESLYIPAWENTAAFALEICQTLGAEIWHHSPPARQDWRQDYGQDWQAWRKEWAGQDPGWRKGRKGRKPDQPARQDPDWPDYAWPDTWPPAAARKDPDWLNEPWQGQAARWAAADPCLCTDCGEWIEFPELINGFTPCPHCLAWIEPK